MQPDSSLYKLSLNELNSLISNILKIKQDLGLPDLRVRYCRSIRFDKNEADQYAGLRFFATTSESKAQKLETFKSEVLKLVPKEDEVNFCFFQGETNSSDEEDLGEKEQEMKFGDEFALLNNFYAVHEANKELINSCNTGISFIRVIGTDKDWNLDVHSTVRVDENKKDDLEKYINAVYGTLPKEKTKEYSFMYGEEYLSYDEDND